MRIKHFQPLVREFQQCVNVLRLMIDQRGGESFLICLEHRTERCERGLKTVVTVITATIKLFDSFATYDDKYVVSNWGIDHCTTMPPIESS